MRFLAVLIGRLVIFSTRLLKLGNGSTLPGLVAEKIDPNIIKKLSDGLKYGVIIVTGTNGKTTTSKMLTEILKEDGLIVLSNSSGSNLTRGIASSLIEDARLFSNQLRSEIAVFEVDEATMPHATTMLRPEIVLVTNLFRDQLDRYGELDKIAKTVGRSLQGLAETKVILNADDPLVSSLSEYCEGEVIYFGLEDGEINSSSQVAMDSKDCISCGHELKYDNRYFGHLGRWSCANCNLKRAKLNYSVSEVSLSPSESIFEIKNTIDSLKITMNIPGLYNIYNALAAFSAASVFEVKMPVVAHTLRNSTAAFGRMELIDISGKKVMMLLVKNPTGANQSISTIFTDKKPKKIAFVLNDNFADGTDVSWIWDIDFESLDLSGSTFIVSGIRAEEAALRLKYAGVMPKNYRIINDPVEATKELAKSTANGEIGYLFPTYTAMMEIRSSIVSDDDTFSNIGKVTKRGV